jgi:hypothetical protein
MVGIGLVQGRADGALGADIGGGHRIEPIASLMVNRADRSEMRQYDLSSAIGEGMSSRQEMSKEGIGQGRHQCRERFDFSFRINP